MKIGDYVRTKDYGFIKVKSFYYNDDLIHILDEKNNEYDFSKKLVDDFKSSSNIIDLIEVGDYVNGYLVYKIKENCVMVGYKCFKTEFNNEEDFLYQTIYANEIKSIVTKEQFESMEYRVCLK